MIDIDTTTLVMSSVLLLGVTAPFITYSIKNKKAKNKFLATFNQFLNQSNLKVDLQEDWRNRYILAIDKTKNFLVYCQIGENENKCKVDLQEVSHAVVHQSYLNSDNPAATNKTLDQVTLQIHFKNAAKKIQDLEIYNHENYSDLLGETMLASKWAKLINQTVTK